MSFELEGKLIEKFDEQQVSDSFKKREFVVETTDEGGGRVFTEQIKFQLVQDKCDLINQVQVGQPVKVSFNIKGRRWEKAGKVNYFTNLDAWRVEAAGENANQSAPAGNAAPPPTEEPPQNFNTTDISSSDEVDDLPF